MIPYADKEGKGIRLNKFLSDCGLGARRKVEELIASGKVTLAGRTVTEPGERVLPGQEVAVDGKILLPLRKRYFLLYKPRGFVCAVSDKRDRTVFDLIGPQYGQMGLFTVGRLDKDSEGLLILTNDGEFAQRLIHPSGGVTKRYEIRLDRPVSSQELNAWTNGALVEGKWVKPVCVEMSPDRGRNWIRVTLREGRKRELRVMAEANGFRVIRLVRTAIGRLEIGDLRTGEIREIDLPEILRLTGIGGND